MSVSLAPSRVVLLNAKSLAAGTGTSAWIDVQGRDELVFYFTSVGTTSGGTLKIEENDFNPDTGTVPAGTPSQLGSDVAASSFTGGATLAIHLSPNVYGAVRVRISADVTGGGTVSVVLKMQ